VDSTGARWTFRQSVLGGLLSGGGRCWALAGTRGLCRLLARIRYAAYIHLLCAYSWLFFTFACSGIPAIATNGGGRVVLTIVAHLRFALRTLDDA